jgi:hypothetical protein
MSLDLSLHEEVFTRNITHNLNRMAKEAGIYECLWRPGDNGFETGKDLIEPLEHGIRRLEENPEKYDAFNASNGWGKRENLIEFAKDVLENCKSYPDAEVRAGV